jgi:glycosyltransferase involved in cell wall biosynthesis
LVTREQIDGVNVVRTWLWPLPNRRAHERVLNYTSFFLSSAVTGSFQSRPDVVIASSPQLLVGLAGWWLAFCKRVPFVFEVRDLWPESLAAVGAGGQKSLMHRTLAKIAGFLYRKAARIVVVTPAFKDHLIKYWQTPAEKISVVENGVETGLFTPNNVDSDLRRELGADGKFVVSYIGTIGMAHGLESLLEAAAHMQHSSPDILFLLLGEGAERAHLQSMAESKGLRNVRFVGQQPREKIPAYIAASDACLVLLKKSDIFKTVIPTKMLEFMSCARPVILGVEGQARIIVEEAQAGICIQPENAHELRQAITRLAANPDLRELLGRNGRRYIQQRFSRSSTAKAYLEVLEDLLERELHYPAVAA